VGESVLVGVSVIVGVTVDVGEGEAVPVGKGSTGGVLETTRAPVSPDGSPSSARLHPDKTEAKRMMHTNKVLIHTETPTF
jgi:hypothetical protein